MSAPLAGAETSTFLAPPSRCLLAASLVAKMPVHSSTTSTPSLPHGSFAGSRSDSTFTFLPSTLMWSLPARSEEHTSELQSLMRISYAVFCLKKTKHISYTIHHYQQKYHHS